MSLFKPKYVLELNTPVSKSTGGKGKGYSLCSRWCVKSTEVRASWGQSRNLSKTLLEQ